MPTHDLNVRRGVYLAVAVALVGFGYLALFSIGFPFALTGLLMLALFRLRGRREVIIPALAWPWVFTLGYVLVAPLGCTGSATPASVAAGAGDAGAAGVTRCHALFFTYAGGGSYDPPLLPALLVGIVLATTIALVLRRSLMPRSPVSTPSQ
jgi:hypothetical protein